MSLRPPAFRFCALVLLAAAGRIFHLDAQDPAFVTRITPEQPVIGSRLHFLLTMPYSEEVPTITLGPVPEALSLIEGPFVQPGVRFQDDGAGVRVNRVFLSFLCRKPGFFRLPALEIVAHGKSFDSAGDYIGVGINVEGRVVVPPKPVWKIPEREVYVMETAAVQLTLTDWDNPQSSVPIPGIWVPRSFMEVVEDQTITDEKTVQGLNGPITLKDFTISAFLVTPQLSGFIVIPETTIILNGYELTTPQTTLSVLPLPGGVTSSKAVGRYSVEANFIAGKDETGKSAFQVRVTGTGNLPFILMPKPVFQGLSVTGTAENRDIRATDKGYEGFREQIYFFEIAEEAAETAEETTGIAAREGLISLPPFSWMDPETGLVHESEAISFALPAIENPRAKPQDGRESTDPSAIGVAELNTIPISPLGGGSGNPFYRRFFWFFLYIPGAALTVAALRRKPRVLIAAAILAAVFFLFLGLIRQPSNTGSPQDVLKDHPYTLYNLAAEQITIGRYPEAVWNLRRALYLKPMDKTLRNAVSLVEKGLSLQESVPLVPRLNPDAPLFLSAFLFALFGAWAAFKKKPRSKALPTVLLVLSITLSGLFGYAYARFTAEEAVLAVETSLLKIPEENSSEEGSLKAGTCVHVLRRFNDYLYIKTGTGGTGWIENDDILPLN